jgi:drug/metabolite transporter (DMT)-like permease
MAFFSRLILKSVISKNQWLGVFVCFLGVTVVGLSDILFN